MRHDSELKPSLIPAAVYGMAGVVCTGGWIAYSQHPAISVVMILALCLFYALSIASGWQWFVFTMVNVETNRRKAEAITIEGELARSIGMLNEAQVELMKIYLTGQASAADQPTTKVFDLDIPDEWIKRFFMNANGHQLPRVRQYPEGSKSRQYAQAVTRKLIEQKAAERSVGNNTARVTSWNDAMKAIGWSE